MFICGVFLSAACAGLFPACCVSLFFHTKVGKKYVAQNLFTVSFYSVLVLQTFFLLRVPILLMTRKTGLRTSISLFAGRETGV